mmetsp:Transcript_62172/g.183825  ORF Transcript_62172/g.183825 Transcript_62172/m.183825 type:complete len:289 (-) Transcript_62172:1229-2095(-)
MHRSAVTPSQIAYRFYVSEKSAEKTLLGMTQRAARVQVDQLTRRFRTRQAQIGRPIFPSGVWIDTLFSETASLSGNTCTQRFCAPPWFVDVFPMKRKAQAGESLGYFSNEWGIPRFLRTDQAQEEMHREWGRVRRHFIIPQKTTEPHSPWQNACKNAIGQHKKWARRIKQWFRVPEVLWDRLRTYTSGLQRCIVREKDDLSGIEELLHLQPDISDYLDFHFYETIKYYDPDTYPANLEHFGKWLGPVKDVGSALCYRISSSRTERRLTALRYGHSPLRKGKLLRIRES